LWTTSLQQAVSAMRSAVVRFLVDHEGLSQTDVARRLHVSRQAVARLYISDPDDETFDPDTG
jgi:predicted transcriptional regulator